MAKRGKKGTLSPEDKELWHKVAKTLTPLDPRQVSDLEKELSAMEASQPTKEPKSFKSSTAIRTPTPPKASKPALPLHQLDHKYRRKLVRGVRPFDARIDLHGLTQHQAHENLRSFLYVAQTRGHKIVLVITGKGSSEPRAYMEERGVLRRMVPQWLSMPDLRLVVLGYEEAHVTHGGSGALYVRIRKKR